MHNNPFIFSGAVKGNQYIPPAIIYEKLKGLMASEENCIILSHQGWGKSSLLLNASEEVVNTNKKLLLAYFDLHFDINEHKFLQLLANALMSSVVNSQDEYINLASRVFETLRPELHFDNTGKDNILMSFDWSALEQHRDEVLQLPERLAELTKKNILVCIDSFDYIAGIEEPLKLLRAISNLWSKHKRASYYFSANARHPFRRWVSEPSAPFYEFAETLFLHNPEIEKWTEYIVRQFTDTSKYISNENATDIVKFVKNQPVYINLFASEVWNLTERRVTKDIIKQALERLLDNRDTDYRGAVQNSSKSRLNYLRMMCGNSPQMLSSDIKRRHGFENEQKLRRIIRHFEKQNIIFSYKGSMRFNDALFEIWFRKRYLGLDLKVTSTTGSLAGYLRQQPSQ